MNQACTKTNHSYRPRGITGQSASSRTAPLLIELVQALRPPQPASDAPPATDRSAYLLDRLLAENGRSWSGLQQPELLTFRLAIRNDRLEIRVGQATKPGPVLKVQFDRTGRLLRWQSWSPAPAWARSEGSDQH